ncbi:MAG: hypothetical protein AAF267_02405, partial [Deinococcota bacterium]
MNARMPFFDLILWYAAIRIANKLYALHKLFKQRRLVGANEEARFQAKLFVLGGALGLEAARYLSLELGRRLETSRLVVGIHIPAEIKHPTEFLDGLDALLDGDDPPQEDQEQPTEKPASTSKHVAPTYQEGARHSPELPAPANNEEREMPERRSAASSSEGAATDNHEQAQSASTSEVAATSNQQEDKAAVSSQSIEAPTPDSQEQERAASIDSPSADKGAKPEAANDSCPDTSLEPSKQKPSSSSEGAFLD